MIDSFDRSEFLGFFCEDGRVFLDQLRQGLAALAAGGDGEAFEACTRAAHSLTGAARMMKLPVLGSLFASTELLLEGVRRRKEAGEGERFEPVFSLTELLDEGLRAVCVEKGEDASLELRAAWCRAVEDAYGWAREDPALGILQDEVAGSEPQGADDRPPSSEAEADGSWSGALSLDTLRCELEAADPGMAGLFVEEIGAARDELLSLVADLGSPDRAEGVGDAARRWVHLFAGSASMVGLLDSAGSLRALEEELDVALAEGGAGRDLVERVRQSLSALLLIVEDREVGETRSLAVEPEVESSALDEETLTDFEDEARDLLDRLEAALLQMEAGAEVPPLAQEALRAAHTLKGIAFTVGRDGLGRGAHRFEESLESLRAEPANAKTRIAPGLAAVDLLRELAGETRPVSALLSDLERVLGGGPVTVAAAPSPGGAPEGETLRVPARRLDQLMDLVGELVISRNRMATQLDRLSELRRALRGSQERLVGMVESFRRRYEFQESAVGFAAGSTLDLGFSGLELDRYDDLNVLSRSLIEISADTSEVMREVQTLFGGFGAETESLQRITSTLQADISSIRMVPVSRLFQRLIRPLRDAARSEEREVRTEIVGGETEIDRAVLDSLYGALVHLVRNAVAHGLESPEQRRAQGKPPVGLVRLQARQEGGRVSFEVTDDGRGVDWDGVREAATRLGVETREREPQQLLFVAGVSTRHAAGALAGRGIGLAAVREAVERIGGRIDVRSLPGAGTTIVVDVPTTLAIHQALVVEAADEAYAIPLSVVDEVATVRSSDVQASSAGPVVLLRGEPLPCQELSRLVGAVPDRVEAPAERPAVIARVGGRRQVLLVDRIASRQEIVLKGLGRYLDGHPYVQGASFAGDGTVVLVLDVASLLAGGAASRGERRPPARLPVHRPGGRCRVLVVDDSLSVRRAAQRLLTDLGAEVQLARDGVEALETLRLRAADLVLTDLEMPRLNGFELIASLRRNETLASLPIVVISSRGSEKHRRHAEGLGASGYITKPFSREDLAVWVRQAQERGPGS